MDREPSDWQEIEQLLQKKFGPELEKFGVEKVWQAGIDALGYPPSWAVIHAEVEAVRTELERND